MWRWSRRVSKKLTKFLDNKYSELKEKLGNIGENKLLLITTIKLIDISI